MSELKNEMEGVLYESLPQMADHQMNMIQQGLGSETKDYMREPTEAEKANMLAQTTAGAENQFRFDSVSGAIINTSWLSLDLMTLGKTLGITKLKSWKTIYNA